MSEPIVRQRRIPPAGLGPALRAARERAGLSQNRLARLVLLTPGYVAKLESGTRCPSVTVARRLSEELGLEGAPREQLLAAAVDDAGRDHPYRHGT